MCFSKFGTVPLESWLWVFWARVCQSILCTENDPPCIAYSDVVPEPLLTHDPLRSRFRVSFQASPSADKCVNCRSLCLLCLMIRVNRNCVTVLTATSIEDALWTMYFEVLSSLLFDAKGLFICDYWLQLYHRSDAKFCAVEGFM